MNIKKEAVSGVKWSGVSMGVITCLQFVSLAVLARLLSPSDFGLMGMVMVVIGFVQAFADMGISNAIIHRQDTTRDELSSLYWLNILAGITVFFIVCVSVPIVVAFYNEPRLKKLLYLTAVIFLITPFGQQFQILLQKELKFKRLARIEIASSFANAMVSIPLAFAGMGVFSLIWGQIAGASLRALLLCRWGLNRWKLSMHFSRRDLKGYIGFGLYQMGERSVNYFNANLDYLLIGALLGAKSLGYYTLAYNLVLRPSSMINPTITKVAFPVFAKVKNNTDKLKKGYLKVIQLLSSVNFPMMVGLAAVAPLAVPVIFGEQWMPSIVLIQILTIVGLLQSINNPVGSLLLAKGRADLGFKWNVALMITQIPGLYIGAKLGGTVGVAIAFAVLLGIYSIFIYIILIRTLIGPCLREYVFNMWPFLWLSALMGGVVLLVGIFLQNFSQQFVLIVQILCGVFVYFVLAMYSQKVFFFEIKEMLFPREKSM